MLHPDVVVDSIAEWEDASAATFVPLRCHGRQHGFHAEMSTVVTGSSALSWMVSAPVTVERTEYASRQYVGDDLLLTLQLRAASTVMQDGRTSRISRGRAAAYDPRRPYVLDFPERGQELIVVRVDRRELGLRPNEIDRAMACPLDQRTPGVPALFGLAGVSHASLGLLQHRSRMRSPTS
ncbi:AraC-like ligand-binding domain-containing protein [Tsukamurella soli]|uniref:AraC-like ligand-binding domain-containing protein n=1 Tax=Tsukamurella soli TaxID=644556 RepID=UPI00361B0210